jgi:hypothetical protein
MKRAIVGIAIALTAGGCTQSTRISSLQMPEETVRQVTPVDVAAYTAKYPTYDGVMLEVERTIEHSGIKDVPLGALFKGWVFSYVFREKYIILNTEARWLSTYELPYKPDKLYMAAVSPSGQVSYFGKTDLQVVKDDKGHERYEIAFPRVEKGTVVEVGWEESYDVYGYHPAPLGHDITLQYAIPCEHLKFTFAYPDWWKINIKQLAPMHTIPFRTEQDEAAKKTMLVYEASDIPALRPEPYCPSFKQVSAYLQFRVTSLEMQGIKWDPELTWSNFAENFRTYAIKKAAKRSKDVARVADSLIAGAATAREKVERIVSWVSGTIEPSYSSNNADPGKTLSSRRGTIYDITCLAQAMLLEADITSDYLLVHDADDGWFDPAYVSEDQLWSPALSVETDSLPCLVFPWIKRLPTSIIPDKYSGEAALQVEERVAGTIVTLPQGGNRDNTTEQQTEVTVDTAGRLNVVQVQTVKGISAYNIRYELDKMDAAERRKMVDSMLAIKGADLAIDSFTIENDSLYAEPLVFRFYYTIRNLVAITPEEIVVQTADLLKPALESKSLDSMDRQNPVWIHHDEQLSNTVVIHYPDTWGLTTPLQDGQIENGFGVRSCEYQQEPGRLTVKQSTLLKKCQEPREKIADLVKLIGIGSGTTAPALVFRPAGAESKP